MPSALAEPLTSPPRTDREELPSGRDERLSVCGEILGRYSAADGERRIIAAVRPDGRILVLDINAGSLTGACVVAQLYPEEPRSNARLLAEMYLADPARGRCRRLSSEDLLDPPSQEAAPGPGEDPLPAAIDTPHGRYEIRALARFAGAPQLRWTRSWRPGAEPRPLTLREVIGTLERYEPALAMTAEILTRPARRDIGVSLLTAELARITASPIVLNRGLREAVNREVLAGTTMSAIAMRCGRSKSDRNGQRSGETSWLARRIGQMPEGGQEHPTPWIHSDTLALIARDGLGLSPREVEL